LDWKSGDLWVS